MKLLTGSAANIMGFYAEDGRVIPMVEVVVAVLEPLYDVRGNDVVKLKSPSQLRFFADASALHALATQLDEYASEVEEAFPPPAPAPEPIADLRDAQAEEEAKRRFIESGCDLTIAPPAEPPTEQQQFLDLLTETRDPPGGEGGEES